MTTGELSQPIDAALFRLCAEAWFYGTRSGLSASSAGENDQLVFVMNPLLI